MSFHFDMHQENHTNVSSLVTPLNPALSQDHHPSAFNLTDLKKYFSDFWVRMFWLILLCQVSQLASRTAVSTVVRLEMISLGGEVRFGRSVTGEESVRQV